MKRLVLLHFVALLMLVLDSGEASRLASGRSRSKKLADRKAREVPYVCLDVSIDLPPCNFVSKDDDKTHRKSHSKRALLQLESMKKIEDPEELTQRQFSGRSYSRALTIVYKIEGCIPSRLPFHLPKCKMEDTAGKMIEERRLFPFTLEGFSEPNMEPPLVFPSLDMNEWHRNIKRTWTRPMHKKNGADVENSNEEELYKDQQSELKMLKVPKRKKVEYDEKMEKKKVIKKIVPTEESREINENDILSKYPSSFMTKPQMTNYHAGDINSYETGSNRVNSLLDDDENPRRVIERGSKIDYLHEFPYAEAIPYDPEKLQMARQGSEFPYSRAIPYDSKKLAERGEMIEAARSPSPFYSRRLKFIKTRSADFRDDVPFDASMIDAAKDGGIFPYVKEIPADTSKSLHPRETQKSRETEKIKVPVRHVMRFWRVEIPTAQRKLRSIDEKKIIENNFLHSENENESPEIVELSRRVIRNAMESSTTDFSSGNDGLEIPRRWSEFPYSRAIPFDPEKLRHPRSMMVHLSSSFHEIPRDFPYEKAIPHDSWKLVAPRRRKNQSPDERTSPDERKLLDRLQRASLNY